MFKKGKLAVKDICHECLSGIVVKEIVAERIMAIIPFKEEEDVDICGTIPLTNLILGTDVVLLNTGIIICFYEPNVSNA